MDKQDNKKTLIAWLNDAMAMEEALVPVLKNHAKDAQPHPEIAQRIQHHAEETERHATIVRELIHQLGEKPSGVKSAIGKIFGVMQAPLTGFANDELIKNCLLECASEQFEIASYRSLIAAAEHCGEHEIARQCEQILQEEEQTLRWLHENLPQVTQMHLQGAVAA